MTSTSKTTGSFGVIGLGVMGRNLALNARDCGATVVGHDRSEDSRNDPRLGDIATTADLAGLVQALPRPRRLLVMVPAGGPVDAVLGDLEGLLEPGDVVVDGGNSHFQDTRRRAAAWDARELRFFGMGVSGGEEGARRGPSMMPGGHPEGWRELQPLLEAMSAKTADGPCVTHCGPDGAGHFVKTVHNGIEYADMQLIAESHDLLSRSAGLGQPSQAELFHRWNEGPLGSFLIEITAKILAKRDESGDFLLPQVLDQAGSKGTGRWTVESALALGVPVPTIAAALDGRGLSALRPLRLHLSAALGEPCGASVEPLDPATLESALLLAKAVAYAQGFHLLREASQEYDWDLRFTELARIWKGGCIIRARLLDDVQQTFTDQPGLTHLFFGEAFADLAKRHTAALRQVVQVAARGGIPVPALNSSLAYLDALRTRRLPQSMTQAQRDAFGAHTFRRLDDPEGPAQHAEWLV